MAEAAAPAKGIGATLSKKVGPFPLGVWAAAGLAGVWYYERKKAAAASSNPAAAQSQTGYGTDPAGNTGYIDPQSGYVYGSAEDIAALQSQGLVGQNSVCGRVGQPHLRDRGVRVVGHVGADDGQHERVRHVHDDAGGASRPDHHHPRRQLWRV